MLNKNFFKLFIFVMIFKLLSVDVINAQSNNQLNGTWVNADGFAYSFDNGNFSVTKVIMGILMDFDSGTYTINGNTITVTTRLFGTFKANFSINGNVLLWAQEGGVTERFIKQNN